MTRKGEPGRKETRDEARERDQVAPRRISRHGLYTVYIDAGLDNEDSYSLGELAGLITIVILPNCCPFFIICPRQLHRQAGTHLKAVLGFLETVQDRLDDRADFVLRA